VIKLRNSCTGHWPVHLYQKLKAAAAALVLAAAPIGLGYATPASAATVAAPTGQTIADFYKARKDSPLWLAPNAGDSAQQLISLLSTASLDGLDPDRFRPSAIQAAVETARRGKRKDIARAEQQLSEGFVAYVQALRTDPGGGISWVDPELRPAPPSPLVVLLGAASAPSLSEYVRTMGWMHPFYGELRNALADHKYSEDRQREVLALNLKRARVLPAGKQRYVLVNAAQQRLFMYENGAPMDSMVVVVGKTKYPTPMLAAYIRYAALNPYWYVPPDLAWDDVGQFVKKQGFEYFEHMGYEQVSDWGKDGKILDATKIDWDAVRDGTSEVLLRQKPGPENFMGRMKFMFPNQFGVYLHDNPRRELFKQSARFFSGGCVRLEDAARLGRWLFGRDLDWRSAGIEQPVPLADPVPVYITYLTAVPDGGSIAYFDDVYGRDAAKMADAPAGGGTPVVSAAK
jgi:murein L,D-transpeptidase YcbB/YkuD